MTLNPADLRLVYYPDPVLLRPADPIPEITDEVRAVARRMIDLMHEHDGLGLAAPQVGLPWRLFVANSHTSDDEPDRVYINPEIVVSGDIVSAEEGCLSLPGINAEVRRPASARITAKDIEDSEFSLESDDLLARVWQHEFDHLNGVLIINRMSTIDRLATRRALRELEKSDVPSRKA